MRLFGTSRQITELTREVSLLRREVGRRELRRDSPSWLHLGILWSSTAVLLTVALLLLTQALPPAPMVGMPGQIGVALAEKPRDLTVNASVTFDAHNASMLKFSISIFIAPTSERSFTDRPVTVALLFCGPVRDDLRLSEVNGRPLSTLRMIQSSSIGNDSALGPRADCAIATATSSGLPIYVNGRSPHAPGDVSGKRALYAFPGVQTLESSKYLGVEERVNGQRLWPMPEDTDATVSVVNLRDDALIDAAAPQLPQTGQPSWPLVLPSKTGRSPSEYRVVASLTDADNDSQARLFFAGLLAGLAGGTFTAALPPSIAAVVYRVRWRRKNANAHQRRTRL